MTKNKETYREKYIKIRQEVSKNEREIWNAALLQNIIHTIEYKKSEYILCYVGFDTEVPTLEFLSYALKDGKKVYVPKVLEKNHMEFYRILSVEDLSPGKYHIPEPLGAEEDRFKIDQLVEIERQKKNLLMMVPGLVFDQKGNRIGYGQGYYDRYLNKMRRESTTKSNVVDLIGICYDIQVVNELPADQMDHKMHTICTNDRVFYIEHEKEND